MKHRHAIPLAVLLALPARAADNLADPGARVGAPPPAAPAATVPAPVADLAEAQQARAALEELLRAYETGNLAVIQSRLSPSMIGYQRFIDGLGRDSHLMKQIRVHLHDTQVMAGPDVAVIQTGWEKRYLPLTAMATPQLLSGRGMFLLHRDQGNWRIAAMAGDNPFASLSGVMGQISLSQASIPGPCPVCNPVLTVTLVDPDIAGQGSATVEVVSSQGERETFTLTETTPGRFINAAVPFDIAGGFVPGNGVVEGTAGSLILFTFRYLDRTPGGNRPPSLVVKQLRAGP
ncbi:MAG TPA: nuclear transport factor 2 family protein [Thiobacillaceae bacterium]|nr:nuclear transport factor 2 family protein [Thiobacillaceae bacterium]